MKHFKTYWNPHRYFMCVSKHSYKTIKVAKAARKRRKTRVELYIYKCPYCEGFHLTKQPHRDPQ